MASNLIPDICIFKMIELVVRVELFIPSIVMNSFTQIFGYSQRYRLIKAYFKVLKLAYKDFCLLYINLE